MLLAANARTVAGAATEPIRLYTVSEQGLASAWTSVEFDWARAIDWRDYDGDGDLDFAIGTGFGLNGRNKIYANDGAGAYSIAWISTTQADTRAIQWADIDADGDLDLVVGVEVGVGVYRNDAGVLTPATLIDIAPNAVRAMEIADIDGDGDLDIGLATAGGAYVFRKDAAGFVQWFHGDNIPTSGFGFGDYDRDGDLDFAVGTAAAVQVFQQTGAGFVLAFDSLTELFPVVRMNVLGLRWFDYDNDGDVDLALAACAPPVSGGACTEMPQRLLRNSGGSFSLGWVSTESALANAVDVADFDRDGDLDLAFGNIGANRVYKNEGGASFTLFWTSAESEATNAVRWAQP